MSVYANHYLSASFAQPIKSRILLLSYLVRTGIQNLMLDLYVPLEKKEKIILKIQIENWIPGLEINLKPIISTWMSLTNSSSIAIVI